jgi:hypothetical protein
MNVVVSTIAVDGVSEGNMDIPDSLDIQTNLSVDVMCLIAP